ncbi:ABC transporter ATP-binding protein [Nocardioides jishulii]|uniref:ABC transporter ATP-binding protein n=1 Tax=Nocardioides jishulii TaxID=2575440 RepID=A0A4U2YID3_9ACTN|nr:ABC transporter ATP-binding protein [Nocardioides jishulii]QCX28134.1 ABC transporter ATP-binding protein [Nocardioides jishulii]TKI60799.1 ABC transporter ATP-binding protein [Nocardioides jishulii]
MTTTLAGHDLVLGYPRTTVVHGVSVDIRPGVVTALVGPNGSGKSTVLRSLARLHPVTSGSVELDGVDSAPLNARAFARRVTLLSQSRPHPSGVTVQDVVTFGRHPHRHRFSALSADDHRAIDDAMTLTGVTAMADRPVDQLSGGELQRVWLASCLAQDTGVILLDEPTNHLDLRYQVETLDLVRDLADHHGTAVGVVLHDLNQTAAVADRVVLLHHGRVIAAGDPADVLTSDHLSEVYGLLIDTTVDPETGRLRIDPRSRHLRR